MIRFIRFCFTVFGHGSIRFTSLTSKEGLSNPNEQNGDFQHNRGSAANHFSAQLASYCLN